MTFMKEYIKECFFKMLIDSKFLTLPTLVIKYNFCTHHFILSRKL